ncbi:sigma-70 family RNA polymerase sigma factor [Ruminococcaceae bacterium OttesenSCG-928-A16]|nr:sigma-70 family RNA polymerase sigma factor [Ruminococcaceae bacterium OttesenSCG-928-A16]
MTDQQFGDLITQYEKLVYTICYQFTRNHHTAQDLAQEAFLSAYSHLDSCPEGNEKPWLARIATNKAKDFLKSAYNRKIYATADDTLPEDKGALFMAATQPEDITIEKDTVEQIAQDIRNLKEPYQQVAILYFLEEKTVDEIATQLERPPKTVHTQLYRAKHKLQQTLKGGDTDEFVF